MQRQHVIELLREHLADDARIDLHAHTRESDGTHSPTQLVELAGAAKLDAVAITDHDTTSGWAEASSAARAGELVLVPGIEFSARFAGSSVHVLGYLFDPDDAALTAELARIREERSSRARRIVELLSADFDLDWSGVEAHVAPGATLGRPHIADALVERGIIADRSEAFTSLLAPGEKYYVTHPAPDPERAIELIRGAGGLPVIAHPAGDRRAWLPKGEVARFVRAGLYGLELAHRENTPEGRAWISELVAAHGLVPTGGSDWHGDGKPNPLGENWAGKRTLIDMVERSSGSLPVLPEAWQKTGNGARG